MLGAKLQPNVSATALGSARARRAISGSGRWRCSARCGMRGWSPTSSLLQSTALGSAPAGRASGGSGPWRCSARCGTRSWSPTSSLLQRWDQRVREGRAVAGGSGAAQRDVGGDAGARCHRYSAGISACEKAEKWQRALVLLSKMWEVRLEPNVISLRRRDQRLREGQAVAAGSGAAHRCAGGEARAQLSYNAGISACENGEQWQRALALVSEMQDAKLEPNITSPTMCWDQRLRKGQSVAAGFGAAQRSAGGEAGARGHQLQRWGQSVREGRAMAAGFGAAWRDAGGETRSGQHQLHRWGQRVRVWRAVATGFGVAQRDVGDDV
ncbi:unnamed protein product [Prorocentrum cordatum]|nr:unnamed protein product [Polarella glacialis]